MIPIPGHNLTLNHDSGSKFNVELIPRVIFQRGIKTRCHNSTGGPNFIRRRGRNSMTPCLWGRNSTWKIRWILSTARWIKTPQVEIQWGQNSILHRKGLPADNRHSNGYALCPSSRRLLSVFIRSGIHTVFALNGKETVSWSRFNLTYEYIDAVLSINNPECENYLGQMYPAELEFKNTTESITSASCLDLLLSIGRDDKLHTSIYDKRDDFNFNIRISVPE